MTDPNNDSTTTINDDGRALITSTFLEFCAKVRNSDPSILPDPGKPFKIGNLSEKEDMELADALLENSSVTYLELETGLYTKSSAEAMAKYVRTSKRLQRIRWNVDYRGGVRQREEMLCCLLSAFQESTSLKELHMELPPIRELSNLALENMLTHTQSLRSLSIICPVGLLQDIEVAAARSGLQKNSSLRELTLDFSLGTTGISPILTSLRDLPLLQRLCLLGDVRDLTGLETVLLSDISKITELDIHRSYGGSPLMGLTPVLQALARRPTLTKLVLRFCRLGLGRARVLRIALCNTPSLQSLVLKGSALRSAGLEELAPSLYRHTSIKELDTSFNGLVDIESARLLRDIIRHNKIISTLDLSGNQFGQTTGGVESIADGLGSNSTLLKIDLSTCALGDDGVSTLAQTLGSLNTTLQKLNLSLYIISSTGAGALLETMEQNSSNTCHIADLDLKLNSIGNDGVSLLAMALANNVLPNLTRLSLYGCGIGNDGFIALVSALEQNTSLLHLDLCFNQYNGIGERAFWALAKSLPEIKVLQRVDLTWCTGFASAMPLLLAGLRKNTSLLRFHVRLYNLYGPTNT